MPIKRPIFLYSLLATLFAITLLYQVRYLPDLFRRETLNFPFFFVDPGSEPYQLHHSRGRGLWNP